MAVIHKANHFAQFIICVAGNGNQLGKHFISQCLDLLAEGHSRIHFFLFKNDTDAVQAAFCARFQIFNAARTEIDHAYYHRIAMVKLCKVLFYGFAVRHNCTVRVIRTALIQKADLDNINFRTYQAFKQIRRRILAKVPVVYVTTITQCAIQQLNFVVHVVTTSSTGRYTSIPYLIYFLNVHNLLITKFSGIVTSRLTMGAMDLLTLKNATSIQSNTLDKIDVPP